MGFSIKELTYKEKHLLYLTDQKLAGPWFSFKIRGKKVREIPVILKNIEPTPIYKLINSRKGKFIHRITLDFDVNEYLRDRAKIEPDPSTRHSRIRLYVDIFSKPKVPFINTFFTLRNISEYKLINFSMYFIFDFDVNGLDGYDTDMGGFDEKNNIIFQYDDSGLHAGFSTISKPTNFESSLSKDFKINKNTLDLTNKIYPNPGERLSALQIEFKTLVPNHSFQTALSISGGDNKKELIENIKNGKTQAIKFLSQVNKSVKSKQRNLQQEAFVKINQQKAEGCN
ncbi:MAG: hypothetical protein EU521_01515 [Promethearchaeota archaeon]|nr:MAG: hypothetical protein EU521_01515 [Candidatus Lokiarchaeota archaeon]